MKDGRGRVSLTNASKICFDRMFHEQVPSYVMLGVRREPPPAPTPVVTRSSALRDACLRKDLTAIHEFMVKLHYKDDLGESEVKSMASLVTFMCKLLVSVS